VHSIIQSSAKQCIMSVARIVANAPERG
jgi:hypothetical protein